MKVLEFLNKRIEEIILVVTLGIMTISIGLQVFMRYVMQNSLSWSEELARYLFILFIYTGISYGVKKKRHVCVKAFTMWMPVKIQKYIEVIADLIFLFFAIVVVYYGHNVASRIFRLDQISAALELRMGYIFTIIPVCYSMVCIRLLQNLYGSIVELMRGGKGEA